MSGINITSVDVLDNPTKFTNPLIFEIQYECLQRLEGGAWSSSALYCTFCSVSNAFHALPGSASTLWHAVRHNNQHTDLEFKLIYVGSADDESKDQVLDEVLLGPVDTGNYRFVFQVAVPHPCHPDGHTSAHPHRLMHQTLH